MEKWRVPAIVIPVVAAVALTAGFVFFDDGHTRKAGGTFTPSPGSSSASSPAPSRAPLANSGRRMPMSLKTRSGGRTPGCGMNAIMVPSCGVWWGIYSIKGGTMTSAVTDVERRIKRPFDVVLRYHDFSNRLGPGQFPDSSERELGRTRLLFFAWESRQYSTGTNLQWRDIAAGRYDGIIRPVAKRVRDYRKKVFLSFDPEMDRHTGYRGYRKGTEAEYVAAARHVHRVFDSVGAKNVIWVWTTTGYLGSGYAASVKLLYPGDGYVDWVGWDPYNFYQCKGSSWETFDQSIGGTYQWMQQNGFGNKPFFLPEYGTQYDSADPARSRQWYLDMPTALTSRYPNIKGLIRWNSGFSCGLALDNGPGMVDAFAKAGRSSHLRAPRVG